MNTDQKIICVNLCESVVRTFSFRRFRLVSGSNPPGVVIRKRVFHVSRSGSAHRFAAVARHHPQGHINACRNACRGENVPIFDDVLSVIHLDIRKQLAHPRNGAPMRRGAAPIEQASAANPTITCFFIRNVSRVIELLTKPQTAPIQFLFSGQRVSTTSA